MLKTVSTAYVLNQLAGSHPAAYDFLKKCFEDPVHSGESSDQEEVAPTLMSTDELMRSFLMHTFGQYKKGGLLDQVIDSVPEAERDEERRSPNRKVYAVSLSINGVPVDFAEFSRVLHDNLDLFVIKHAKNLLFDGAVQKLRDTVQHLTEQAEEVEHDFEMELKRRYGVT